MGDWFAENAPKDTTDWFAANAPAPSDATGGQKPAPNMNRSWARTAVHGIPPVAAMLLAQFGEKAGGAYGLATAGPEGMVAGARAGRLAGAYGGGFAGNALEMPFQTLLGEQTAPPFTADALRSMNASGNQQMALEGTGMVANAGLRGAGNVLMRGALRPPVRLTRDAMATLSQMTGRPVEAAEADLGKQAVSERVAPGRMLPSWLGGTSGSGQVRAKFTEPMAQRTTALDRATQAGHRVTIYKLGDFVPSLRSELSLRTNGPSMNSALDNMVDEVITGNSAAPVKGIRGKALKLDPQMVQKLKETWQGEADQVYKQIKSALSGQGAMPEEKQQLRGLFAQKMARGAREWLEALPGHGRTIAAANKRMQSLMPLEHAVTNAEVRESSLGLPLLPTAIGAAAGGFAGHSAGGAGEGALLGMLGYQAARSPLVQGRAALGITHPALLELSQRGPRALAFLLEQNQAEGPASTPDYNRGSSRPQGGAK